MDLIPPGTRYGGYQVDAQIGEGGMAVVARGHDVRTGKVVALKVLTPQRRADMPGLRDRLYREADVLSALGHIPYVVGFVETFEASRPDGSPGADVLVLEFIDGKSLLTLLGGPPLPVMQVMEWMGHACHALYEMHEAGFVHRDLKPDNLMLVEDAAVPLRLIDFNSAGAARATQGRLTQVQGTFPYTPAYLAPECFDGIPADESADVYALGMTFAELLLGRHPLLDTQEDLQTNSAWQQAHEDRPFPDLTAERPEIPRALQQILADACAKDRRERIGDAVELWERLKTVWDALQAPQTPIPAKKTQSRPVVDPPAPRRSRLPMLVAGVGLLALLGAGAAGGMWWMEQRRLAYEAEVERLAKEQEERKARLAEEQRQRLEEQRKEQERLEKERLEQERRQKEEAVRRQAETRAKDLGATAVAAVIEDPETLEKVKNSTRFGSHHIYWDKGGMGSSKVEELGEVLFLEAIQTHGSDRVALEGVITKVDARGITVDGRLSIVYKEYNGKVDRCTRRGKIRLGTGGHPHYFRAHGDCSSWHYIDLFADEAWLEEHPKHKPRW